jgi:N6-adenosine-specific RNA methylase IME4
MIFPGELMGYDYQVILADPPWRYSHSRSKSRRVEQHYPTLTTEEICMIPVDEWAAPCSVLYLWATAPKLPDALKVMQTWGFGYTTHGIWDKRRTPRDVGSGYWFRGQHELLLVGTRGGYGPPAQELRVGSIIGSPRRKHSEKPTRVHELIEQWWPDARRLELFARAEREGWDVWGDELGTNLNHGLQTGAK